MKPSRLSFRDGKFESNYTSNIGQVLEICNAMVVYNIEIYRSRSDAFSVQKLSPANTIRNIEMCFT